jgi:two-component system, LytTR family, response regulator
MPDTAPIRCMIVDDEPPARHVLRRHIEALPSLQLQSECGNAVEAMMQLQQQPIDLLFLDIHMPQLKGTELLKILHRRPQVIFTTAHPEYALEGFELDAVDYLLKPIQFDRFVKAVMKAFHHVRPAENTIVKEEPRKEQHIYVRADRKMVKVLLQDILYIESMKDYVKVVTSKGPIITKQSISAMEAMLPDTEFIRTHRSFIVSVQKIRSYTHDLIQMEKTEIPIGRLFRSQVLDVLK